MVQKFLKDLGRDRAAGIETHKPFQPHPFLLALLLGLLTLFFGTQQMTFASGSSLGQEMQRAIEEGEFNERIDLTGAETPDVEAATQACRDTALEAHNTCAQAFREFNNASNPAQVHRQ